MENRPNDNTAVAISIIMATHNGERFLLQAVGSILSQSFTNFEFLIVNDYSSDQTPQILKEFAQKDQRVKIIHNSENLGLTKSLNNGLQMAQGKYIARMDDDDIAMPSRLQKQYDFMESHRAYALVGSLADIIDETGKTIGEKNLALDYKALKKKLLFNNQLVHSSWFLRASVLKEVGFYNEQFKKAQDYEFLFRLAAKYPVCNLPDILLQYRVLPSSLSWQNKEQQKFTIKARWMAMIQYGYPKAQGLYHILIRLGWMYVPKWVKMRKYR